MSDTAKKKSTAVQRQRAPSPPETNVSVGFVSLGCAKNLVDTQIMAGVLLAENVALAPSPEEADIVIVNTCAFIEDARQESIDAILSACQLKETGACRAVCVTGCLPQRYKEELKQSLPEVDAFIGLDELEDIGQIVRRLAAGEHEILQVSASVEKLFEPSPRSVVLTGGPYAYLKIAEGCNHRCAFCSIPGIRGRHRSRQVEDIVREAEALLEQGFRELNLISQDVTAYGVDTGKRDGLPELVGALGQIGGPFWIRLLYSYPSRVTQRLLETMAATEQVCHYVDVPIQHSHPDILKAMRRSATALRLPNMVERIRKAMPDATVRTTCLVGFPGETDRHFEHLLDFVREVRFDHLGVFTFSPEENTPAFDMPNRPSQDVAEERKQRLMLAQQEIVARNMQALVGTRAKVLLEAPLDNHAKVWLGRSERLAPEIDGQVLVDGASPSLGAGDFVIVKYTLPLGYDIRGNVD